jgi:integrase
MSKRRGAHEGSIFQRKDDGRWVGQLDIGHVDTPKGRRRRFRTVYGTSRADVAEGLTKLLREQHVGALAKDSRLTVGEFLTGWLTDKRVRPSTRRGYQTWVDQHLIPSLGRIRLEKLQPQDVDAMVHRKLEAGLSPRTVHHMRAVLRAALAQAVRYELVPRNVAALSNAVPVPDHEMSVFTPVEAAAFLDAVRGDRLEALYGVVLALGLRQGEALGLRWEDVDLDGRRLVVANALQRVDGKLALVPPKTRRSRRTIELPDAAVTALRAHRARQLEERLLAGGRWHDSGHVFTSTIGTPLDGSSVTRAFQRLLAAAGLPRLRFHDLRHSCATLLLVQGVPARVVMEILGHSSIALTMNTYSHVIPSLKREAADAMDRVFAGPHP